MYPLLCSPINEKVIPDPLQAGKKRRVSRAIPATIIKFSAYSSLLAPYRRLIPFVSRLPCKIDVLCLCYACLLYPAIH